MKMNVKKAILVAAFSAMGCFAIPQAVSAAAPTPVTIDGVVYDKAGKPVPGVTVVAFCGDVSHVGGSNATDASGHYIIHGNSEDCPLGTELTVTTDIDGDSLSDGARHTQTHTTTTINIHLGDYTSVAVPEYGWLGASAAALAGVGTIVIARRRAR